MSEYSGLDKYIERLNEIRILSTPSIDGIEDADEYSRQLRENFVHIGRLAAENRVLLDNSLFPLVNSEDELNEEQIREISSFEEKLLDAQNAENLDVPIAFFLSRRLLQDAVNKKEMLSKLRRMDMQMSACYTMMNMTGRLFEYPHIAEHYRREGMELGYLFIKLREKETFAKIESDEVKELVLTNSRFTSVFYENAVGGRSENEADLSLLLEDLEISRDPFYTEMLPDFDWRYYRYRVLGYIAQVTDFCNFRGFEADQLKEICERTEELWDMWKSDPACFSEYDEETYVELHLFANRYYVGKITADEYAEQLWRIYRDRDTNRYDLCGIMENIEVPVEILGVLYSRPVSAEDEARIKKLFDNVLAYTLHMPNSAILSFMLEFITHFMRYFRELPGGMDFETMMLNLLAALHPPTYVHSRMVALFSQCLCSHLIDARPELFVGTPWCEKTEDVAEKRDEIIEFTRHAALCHDTGKIFIFDTVFVYGRKLLDMEFELIKTHPKMGAKMLASYPSTAKYADVAMGHHKWYDNSRGYPEEFDTNDSPVKTIIDIVQCADCLDAATDTIGRSYNRGITFDDFLEDIREGSGTRYAPWLYELLSGDEVRKDIEYLLTEGRERNYHDTYKLLKSMHNKERR